MVTASPAIVGVGVGVGMPDAMRRPTTIAAKASSATSAATIAAAGRPAVPSPGIGDGTGGETGAALASPSRTSIASRSSAAEANRFAGRFAIACNTSASVSGSIAVRIRRGGISAREGRIPVSSS